MKPEEADVTFVAVLLSTLSSTPKPEKSDWGSAETIIFVGLLFFAAAVSIVGIERPVFIDEAYSILTASEGLRGIIGQLRNDSNLPLYFILLHWWVRCFGDSEIATRVPSILFYFLGIFTTYKLGEELSKDRRVGLYSAFFYGVSLQAIHVAQKVRVYTLLGFLAALSALFFFRCFWKGAPTWRNWVLYTLVNVVGSFAHVWFAFVIFAHIVCYLAFFPRGTWRRFFGSIAVSAIPFSILWGRIFLHQMGNGAAGWIPRPYWWSGPGAILEFYGGKIIGSIILGACVLLLFVKERGDNKAAPDGKRAQWTLLSILALSIAVPLIVSLFKPIYWPGRYTIIALPSFAVLLGWRLAAAVRRPVLAGFACVVLASLLVLHIVSRRDMIENSEATLAFADSDRRTAELLEARIRPGDSLVFTGLSRASVEYYLQRSDHDQGITMISYPAVNAGHLGWDDERPDQNSLAAEAGELTKQLKASNPNGTAHFWILLGANSLADKVLLENMDHNFTTLGVLRCRGAFFSGVVIYPNTPLQPPGR